MGHAPAGLRARADHVCGTTDEEGVREVITGGIRNRTPGLQAKTGPLGRQFWSARCEPVAVNAHAGPAVALHATEASRILRRAMNDRIVIDPNICHGKPVIRGTRTPVAIIVGSLAGGMSFEDVQREYDLTIEDIRAALGFGTNQLRSRFR